MKLGGRIAAAIEVLTDITNQHTPVTDALRDWGKSHRFAGSKDRSFIGNIVHDALRQKSSIAWRMGFADLSEASPRAITLGTMGFVWDYSTDEISAAFADDGHSPSALTEAEIEALSGAHDLSLAPDWVRADVPEWLWPAFDGNFGEDAIAEGIALATRPPLDLRVNTLKSTREQALAALTEFGAQPATLSPIGIRIPAKPKEGRLPTIQPEAIYQTGGVEIQDEGSQIAAILVNAQPGESVLDYCAGGGGKSLAMAGAMNNEGKIYAFDIDKRRLAPLYQRALSAGADMIELRPPSQSAGKGQGASVLSDLKGKMDRVLIDAPCTGTGTWRRKPDAKWRLSEESLERRMNEQAKVLDQAADYVRDSGYLIYVTCSVLAEENEAPVYAFLEANKAFQIVSAGEVWEDTFLKEAGQPLSVDGASVTLTPATMGTDGFFFAVMEKIPANQRYTPETD